MTSGINTFGAVHGVFSLALCLFMSLSLYVLKSHESFTYVSPNVFLVSFKSLIINILQETVRVSFSAPNASQICGAFLLCLGWFCAARLVYMSRLYRKTSAERLSLVQVPRIWPIIRPIPEYLNRKPRPLCVVGVKCVDRWRRGYQRSGSKSTRNGKRSIKDCSLYRFRSFHHH